MLVFLFATALLGLTVAVEDASPPAEEPTKPTDNPKVITTTIAAPESTTENGTIPLIVPKEGDVCNILRLPRFTEKPGEYLECVKPQDDEDWAWEGIGLWEKKSCPKGKVFSPLSRSCKNANAVRRQYLRNCQNFGGCHQVYQPCQQGACQQPQQGAWTGQQPSQWVNLPQQVQPCQGNVGGCQPQQIIHQPQPIIQPVQQVVHPVQPVVHQPYVEPSYVHQHVVHPPIVQPQMIHQPIAHPQPVITHVQPPVVQTIHPVVEPVQPYVEHPIIQPQIPVQPIQPHIHTDCGTGTSGYVGCNPQAYHQPVIAPRPCPSAPIQVTHADVHSGSPCSWMSAPLVQANTHQDYYQCQPTQGNFFCGQWQQQSCGQSQVFNPQVQVCAPQHLDIHAVQHPHPVPVQPAVQQTYHVHHPAPVQQVLPVSTGSCAQQHVPIGQCNVQGQCPGYSQCQQGTCCQNVQSWHG